MMQTHWTLDTRNGRRTWPEACFHGFIYGKALTSCTSYVLERAKSSPNEFILSLNGGFCGYVQIGNRIVVFNDRFGYGKLFLSSGPSGVIVGSSFNDVVRLLDSKTPDEVGILEFIRFGYPLFERTFLQEIRVLPPGSIAEIDFETGKLIGERRYWQFEFCEEHSVNHDELREQLWETLQVAVDDCFADPNAVYAVGNSGGLDSRTILSIARTKGIDFLAYTWGSSGSDAITVGNQIAKKLGLRQENIYIQTDFLPKYWELIQERRPMITLSSSWYYSGIEKLGGCTTNVIGLYGDNTFGIHLIDKYRKMHDDWDQYDYHSLADDDFLATITAMQYDEVRAHYQELLAKSDQPNRIKRFDQWNFENRQFRFIMEEPWVNFLDRMEMRCPFMHNDLVAFAFRIPYELRQNRTLYQEAVMRKYPEIASIRYERMPYSMTDSEWLKIAKKFLWRTASRAGSLGGLNPFYKNTHKHQRQWLTSEPNYSFIVENFRRPSPIFSAMFFADKIAADLPLYLASNWSVTSNLLTIKLWFERFVEGSM